MPRSTRDSDEDVETRTAISRRTRAGVGSIITDSPVRRSSRNKQSTKQSGSPPDSYITEISTQGTRTFRTRAGTADSNTLETQKRLRSSKNSVDTEFETLIETQPKKMTRRSLAAATALDTPKANTRPRRMTRAGSETISTPTGRTTRKTRASSMDPEPTIGEPVERFQTEVINTPMRAKRRASVLPSQSTLIEEEEKQFTIVELDKIVMETDKTSTDIISPNKELVLSKNRSNENNKSTDKMEEEKDSCSVKGPLDDSSESNHMKISETFKTEVKFDESYTPEKNKYSAANVNDDILTKDVLTHSPHSSEDISKESKSKDEDILLISKEEKEMNSSNKENECLNTSNSVSEQNKTISNVKNLHQETFTTVLDTSIKEGKNVESNDNIKLDNSYLIESSVSLSDSNNLIKSNSNVNANEVIYIEEKNKSVSMSDTKEISSNEEEHEKTSTNSTTVTKNLDGLNTVSYKVLVNEDDSIPKEESKINDSSNSQIQDKLIIKEEKRSEVVNQNISNIEEINSNDEIRDKANVSVNPTEKLIDISVKEDNFNNDVNATEIPNINNDEKICNSTVKVVSASKDSNATQDNNSSNDNQDNMSCTSTIDSSLPTLEFSDDSIKDSANDVKQTELDSTKSLLKLKSSKLSTSISEKIDSSTVAESHDIPEADLLDEEESKIQSSSNTPVKSKTKSVTELNISKSKKKEKKNDVQNDDESDNVSDIRMLFQNISADEWKQKNKNINIETQSNSMHSTSTGKLETDSETECDLLLVDKKAWLAAEKLKASKNKEKFDYDSDDTIILKRKLDYLNDKLSNTNKVDIKSKDSAQDNDNNSEVKESMEKSINSSKLSIKETKNELDKVERSPSKSNDKTDIDKSEIDISSHSASKKEKSQKSTPVCNINRSVLVKSLDKQLEEEEEISLSQKVLEDQEAKTTIDVTNKVEVNTLENKLGRQSLDKKQKKNRSLNSSLNKSDKSKQRPIRHNRLNISSSEEEDNTSQKDENKGDKLTKGSGKKRYNKNYSTMVHIGSDSDTCDESIDSSNSSIRNKTPRIPRFLFKHNDDEEENEEHNESGEESNEDKFSDKSIDSDINAEYNLDGKTIGKFSDDDIPGDECRASESEFSDPDDNGSDLADFVVDDDEVEEEDEEEDEGEDEEEDEGEDEEQEGEKENQDIENEEDKKLTEYKNEKKEVESTENTVKSSEGKIKDIEAEEVNKETENKSINVSDIQSDKKKNSKQKINIEIDYLGSDEDEIVSENKVDTISELDSNTSGKKSKKKQKLNENNEIVEETSKDLNESEMAFTKKVKGTNISLTCSTPKADTFQQKQFNKQNISSNEEQENVRLKDLSSDNCDTSKSSITNSKNSKKKRSIENNISTDLLELLKDVNLPKTLLSKKAYLNKTVSPCSETPTTKYLKKQKLNDSAPNINLGKNKNASETDFIDNKNEEQSESRTITAETTELLESNSSISVKRKRSIEMSDSNDQIELRNKKNKISSKLEIHTGLDNEKENSENVLKVNDEKKKRKRKKNKKNKTSKELDVVNVATTVEKKNMEKDEKMEIVTSNESKKNKKKNKNKENIESKDKSNEKFMSKTKNDKKSVETENIPNKKKKKKIMSELPTLQVKEQSKKPLRKNILKSSTMSDAKVSNEMPQNTEFFKSKYEALEAAKRAAESIKANKDMNKNKQRKQLEKIQEKDINVKKSDQIMIKTFTRGIKRLPADVIENLSDVPMNPYKKTKLLKSTMQQTVRSPTTMMKNGFTESGITKAKKNYIPSNSGGTTEFDVVNLQKEKKLKKTSTVVSFRNKMLSRNSRYPVTSYIMYLQKQKVSNKDQCFAKQF